MATLSATDLPNQIQELLTLRLKYLEPITKIDGTLSAVIAALNNPARLRATVTVEFALRY